MGNHLTHVPLCLKFCIGGPFYSPHLVHNFLLIPFMFIAQKFFKETCKYSSHIIIPCLVRISLSANISSEAIRKITYSEILI